MIKVRPRSLLFASISFFAFVIPSAARAADWSLSDNPHLAAFFERAVSKIEDDSSLLQYESLNDWEAARPELRRQLFDMLGLDPLPKKRDLKPVVTGTVEHAEFRVEKLQFQSLPGLYVTANFYVPKSIDKPLPTVLYVCGHARVKDGTISFGNKTGYQHHGAWFARNGYTCLTMDTIQLGEIEGIHHGTYRYGRWWWNGRGYTPAGVEAWNCIRSLDYLSTRPEVDSSRIGVTGRSGGGAYSWWIAALDDRIQCAVPVAGIATMRNHVVDGCIEGHCDCMFMVNKYQWDFAKVAALVAPRPLLISNTDKDRIFPLEGVVEVHRQTRHIYDLYEKPRNLGLHITEGPHKDTQELRIHAFRWMNRWLKQDESLIEIAAAKLFQPSQLKVFDELPADEIVTRIDESFIPPADSSMPAGGYTKEWAEAKLAELRTQLGPLADSEEVDSLPQGEPLSGPGKWDIERFVSPDGLPLAVDVAAGKADGSSSTIFVANTSQYQQLIGQKGDFFDEVSAAVDRGSCQVFSPTGYGRQAWVGDEKKQTQIRRRFALIGQPWDGNCLSDLRSFLRRLQSFGNTVAEIHASGRLAWMTLMAVCLESESANGHSKIVLKDLSADRDEIPVWRLGGLDITPFELIALASHSHKIQLVSPSNEIRAAVDSMRQSLPEGRVDLQTGASGRAQH